MNVTQQQIDDAIDVANAIIASLATKASQALITGCQPCDDVFNEYNKLNVYKYLLGQGLTAVENGCVQTIDLWRVIQEINAMSSC